MIEVIFFLCYLVVGRLVFKKITVTDWRDALYAAIAGGRKTNDDDAAVVDTLLWPVWFVEYVVRRLFN